MTEIETYIRTAAIARGINPDVAVQVAMTEGGVTDPYRRSQIDVGGGQTENSIGPFQMYLGGGLGNEALKAGIDVTKDWKKGVDFALDTAARKKSWGDWHGARNNNISNSAGFTEATRPIGISLASNPQNATTSVSGVTSPYYDPTTAPVTPDAAPSSVVASDTPTPEAESQGWAAKLKEIAEGDTGKGLASALTGEKEGSEGGSGLYRGDDPIQSLLPSLEGSDAARMQAAQSMMAQLMAAKRKPRGLSLTGVPNGLV